ncbi:MAG TPA: DUF1592 domain-containing protein [Verrucomicrobiae bacterium]
MLNRIANAIFGCFAVIAPLSFSAEKDKPQLSPLEEYQKEIQPILKKHCYDCHDADVAKADLNLEYFDDLDKIHGAQETWQTVLERIYAFEMPPPGKNDLPFDKQSKIVQWLKKLPKPEKPDCDQIANDRNANFYRGHVMSRRINRAEYANTIRDLFGVRVAVEELLPADGGGGEGFDTAGNALFTSSIHIEKYIAAADLVLTTVLPDKASKLAPEIKAARVRILGSNAKPSKKEARVTAQEVVSRISRLAFRRPAETSEVERALQLFDRAFDRGDDYVPSLRLALKSVLVSPNFLFLVEPEPDEKGVQPLAALPLASRLSYFIWSSMPDEELLALAESGKLLDPNVYRQQVHRMLQDAKAAALGERFALQWLDLERLGGEVRPDAQKFPEFDSELQRVMLGEVEAVFNYIVKSDSSLLELIDADYTFANERLAKIYGVSDVMGEELRKVAFADKNRGGVTGMAAVHAITSYPLRTSPVLRGRWVLEALIGEKVKPPPPDVPALEETQEKAKDLPLRAQLELHRAKAECASCHDKMDPLGFGMENYDVLGRWREKEGEHAIDSTGKLPSGETFTGPAGLKKILMSRKDDVVKHLVRKMTGYAFGRELNKFDDCVVDKAVEALQQNNYRPSVLVEHIALSFPFRHRFYPKIIVQAATEQKEK